jgi:hypothetical protein
MQRSAVGKWAMKTRYNYVLQGTLICIVILMFATIHQCRTGDTSKESSYYYSSHKIDKIDQHDIHNSTIESFVLTPASNSIKIPVTTAYLKIASQLFYPQEIHYDKSYWDFQRPLGEIGGVLEQWKFREFILPGSNCLDFGAGGGFLLNGLSKACSGRMGIELNPHAALSAWTNFGIRLVNNTDLIPDDWADFIFSNHALEHTFCPWCELVRLLPKLKITTGKLVFVVPAAGRKDLWAGTPDINYHINTWSPQTLGTLLYSAGYRDVQVDVLAHQWPDDPMTVYQNEGEASFIEKGKNKNENDPLTACEYQIRVIARRMS